MKKFINALAELLFVSLLISLVSCTDFGDKIPFDESEVYYKVPVTQAEAQKLGDYLVKEKFFDKNPKSVQLLKEGDTYQFRMVAKEGVDKDEAYARIAETFVIQLSYALFEGKMVEFHICDDQFKTLRAIVPEERVKLEFNGSELTYFKPVLNDEAKKLGEYLIEGGFFNENPKSVELRKEGTIYYFRFVIKPEMDKDEQYIELVRNYSSELSLNVFSGSLVKIHLCDDNFVTLREVKPLE
jgi:hypothetical protein